jgi:hypothetical protein
MCLICTTRAFDAEVGAGSAISERPGVCESACGELSNCAFPWRRLEHRQTCSLCLLIVS